MIDQEVITKANFFQQEFQSAALHKHICIDNFFDKKIAQSLLNEFPPFDNEKAINEFGQVGPKCVHTNIKNLGSTYSDLHTYIRSQDFLQSISELTGIPDLLPDPNLYGGGTHENVDGAELDPHVDFNYDPITRYHRRLNVLFYLNHEWDESWGGAIEFHSDPTEWRAENNKVISYNCVFNRCVIFATSENSWHGFKRIKLPSDKKADGTSRKLISIYLYTKTRPSNEIAPGHGTFYIPYPPKLLAEQQVLGEALLKEEHRSDAVAITCSEYLELLRLVEKRDKLLKASFETEKRLSGDIEKYGDYIAELAAAIHPVFQGYVTPVSGSTRGYYHDKWVSDNFTTTVTSNKKITSISINGWLFDDQQVDVSIQVGSSSPIKRSLSGGSFDIKIDSIIDKGTNCSISITSSRKTISNNSNDQRGNLLFVLNTIEFFH
jgi:Rps23 Pro-64 3,4-dihydroxylase Tpa1-like proline 4-hydroxylase